MIFKRWLFSTLVGTATIGVLVALYGVPRRGAVDVLTIWLAMLGFNNLRIAMSDTTEVTE